MNNFNQLDRGALDAHITGHYGEDQFREPPEEEISMHVHILRVRSLSGVPFWLLCSKDHRLHGREGESKNSLLERWATKWGKPTELTRYKGIHQPSEAAMAIGSIMHPEEDDK